MRSSPSGSVRSTISAMRRVLSSASRWSGNRRGHLRGRLRGRSPAVSNFIRFGRVEVVARADAQQDVVRVVLLAVDVVQVVGDDERQAGLGRQAQQLLVEPALLGDPVVLELEEEAVLAEDVVVLARELAGELPVVDLERLGTSPPRHADSPTRPSLYFARCSRSMRGL